VLWQLYVCRKTRFAVVTYSGILWTGTASDKLVERGGNNKVPHSNKWHHAVDYKPVFPVPEHFRTWEKERGLVYAHLGRPMHVHLYIGIAWVDNVCYRQTTGHIFCLAAMLGGARSGSPQSLDLRSLGGELKRNSVIRMRQGGSPGSTWWSHVISYKQCEDVCIIFSEFESRTACLCLSVFTIEA